MHDGFLLLWEENRGRAIRHMVARLGGRYEWEEGEAALGSQKVEPRVRVL